MKARLLVRAVIASSLLCLLTASPAHTQSVKDTYLELVRKGWVFEYSSAIRRRGADFPDININNQTFVHGDICLLGDNFHPLALQIIADFESLLTHVFARTERSNTRQLEPDACGAPHRTYLRVYGGIPPIFEFNQDLRQLDRIFQIGFPKGRRYAIGSPAQAVTFFGRRGTVAHLLIKQPERLDLSETERLFFRSILIEELFQVFSLGLDILIFNDADAFISKLQELPMNLRGLSWDAPEFMEGILRSNPNGLCAFDIFMLHALSEADLTSTNSEAFVSFVEARFDPLLARAKETLQLPEFASLFDERCLAVE